METIDRFDGTEYRFLSNFHPSEITYDGIVYPTVEHAYQAQKTLEPSLRKAIAALKTPGETKKAGRRVDIRDNWDNIKAGYMKELVFLKFATHPNLAVKLLNTRGKELVEGNTWGDTFFGVCDGVGANHLGRILMEVRDHLSILYLTIFDEMA